jgi:hypothetical protein
MSKQALTSVTLVDQIKGPLAGAEGVTDCYGGVQKMRFMLPATLVAALGSMLLAGCSDDDPGHAAATPSRAVPAATWSDPAPAARAARLGKSDTPCSLPVTFDLAKSWKPAAVPGGVAAQGGFALRCEVDAKPSGHLGFLRVWVSSDEDGDPGSALEAFLAGQPGMLGRQTRMVEAGSLPAAETTYLTDNAELDVRRQERVLAVAAPKGVVILDLGGLSTDEHQRMLPAFVLAKQTLAATS